MRVETRHSTAYYVVTAPFWGPASAVLWVAKKIDALFRHCVGFFVRIGVFMFGEYNKGFWQREIIELFKISPSDPARRSRFSEQRLRASIGLLTQLGGTPFTTFPADGAAKINGMIFRVDTIKKQIEAHGGTWINGIISCQNPNEKWNRFRDEVLLKMGWEEKDDGTIETRREKAQLPPGHLVIHSHSPTESWAMRRQYIGWHLGMGADVVVYDYRGFLDSTGESTEGGLYLDLLSVYDRFKEEYPPENTITTGFCKGAAVAVYLKKVYPEMLFIGENTFDSMETVMRNQSFPGNILGPYGLRAIRSSREEIKARVKQDSFNTAKKLRSLPFSSKGATILINTTTDTTIGDTARRHLKNAAFSAGNTFVFDYTPDKKGNGHSVDPLKDPAVWRRYVATITTLAKGPQPPAPSQTPKPPIGQPTSCGFPVKAASPPFSSNTDQPIQV